MWRFFRGTLIVVITVILTTLAINATDNIGNFQDSLIGSAIGLDGGEACPEDMAYIPTELGGFCIDKFENSPNGDCTFDNPQNQDETRTNLEKEDCRAVSEEGKTPWRNIAQHQAELSCRNAGKRLPTNKEWYQAVLGTPDSPGNVSRGDCNIQGTLADSGTFERCVSAAGAYDMVGNVWEWVSETVTDGEVSGRILPTEGYVTNIDANGIPIETNYETPDPNFNEDYLWVEREGVRGMIRGGYYGNGTDAGQYAINAITPPSFAGVGVGFRCVK